MIVKVMKNGLGEYGIWWSAFANEKCKHLAFKRFFKSKEKAENWAEKFKKKMLKIK